MTDRPSRTPRRVRVVETRALTPRMIRVVLGGEELEGFGAGAFTDHYVKLRITPPGEKEPRTRTYTVRDWDASSRRLTIDFVHHGDAGVAGPWAANARPGDELLLLGPGGAYTPDPDADWHLMVGDESALPAIGAACERVPDGVHVLAVLEVGDAAEHQELDSPGKLDVRWLHRDEGVPEQLLEAVRAAAFPPGDVHAFVHGEAGFVRDVRRHLLAERGVPRERLSVSGYWRRGRDEDGWRADKAAERAAEQRTASGGNDVPVINRAG